MNDNPIQRARTIAIPEPEMLGHLGIFTSIDRHSSDVAESLFQRIQTLYIYIYTYIMYMFFFNKYIYIYLFIYTYIYILYPMERTALLEQDHGRNADLGLLNTAEIYFSAASNTSVPMLSHRGSSAE